MTDLSPTIQEAEMALYDLYGDKTFLAPKLYLYGIEMDFCVIDKEITEIEIKLSRADWMKDRSKKKWGDDGLHIAKQIGRFYYAVPEHMLHDLPGFVHDNHGLIVFCHRNGQWNAVECRYSKRLGTHKPNSQDRFKLIFSTHHKYWNLREKGRDA